MKKRILSTLMALCLALSLLPTAAFAEEGSTGEDNTPVAEVNGEKYAPADFQKAIEAAKEGGTVTLLRDYTLELGDTSLDLSGYDLTFDLGQKTLTINTSAQRAVYASSYPAETNLTIKNGKLNCTAQYYLLYFTNGGNLRMEDLEIAFTGLNGRPMTIYTAANEAEFEKVKITATNSGCVEVCKNAEFTDCTFTTSGDRSDYVFTAVAASGGGDAVINSGSYKGQYALYVYNSGGSIAVKDGTFEGSTAAIKADTSNTARDNSVITVSGGNFTGEIQTGGSSGNYQADISLSGGSYTVDPTQFLEDGFLMDNSSGSYEVKVDTSKVIELVDSFGESKGKFSSLSEAIEAADAYNTLKLIGDLEVSGNVLVSKNITIDLNGHNLLGNGTIQVPNTSGLTIRGDGQVSCALTNEGAAYNLSLNGGSYSGAITGNVKFGAAVKFSSEKYPNGVGIPEQTGYEIALSTDGKWYEYRAITYTIYLHLNGGTLAEGFEAEISYPYTGKTVVLPKVSGSTREIFQTGYKFGGWYYDAECSGTRASSATSGIIYASSIAQYADDSHSLNLYAKWTKISGVAAIGEKGYDSLQDAVNAAASGDTITLLEDVPVDNTAISIEKNVTIDLNGCTITGNDTRVFHVKSGTLTLTGTGTVTSVKPEGGSLADSQSVIRVGDNDVAQGTKAALVIDDGVTVAAPATYGVSVFGSGTEETVTIRGAVNATGPAAAVSGNGSYDGTTIALDGAAISATCGVAIYHPQGGVMTITDSTVDGGIEAKSGTITIENSTISATDGVEPSHNVNGNGPSTSGYAIAIVDNAGYNDGAKLTVNSGTINGDVVYLEDDNGVAEEDAAGTIAITGGTFNGAVSAEGAAEKNNIDISGGSFAVKVDDAYCAEGYAPVTTVDDNGMYTVTKEEDDESTTVTGLTLTPKSLTLREGETYQLQAAATPANSSLTWTSNNTAVATVSSSGRVTAVSEGTATITVAAGSLSLTCLVQVNAAPASSSGGSSDPSYSPKLDISDGGTVKVSPRTPERGDKVTITPDPDRGYEVDEVIVTNQDGDEIDVTANRDGTYTFVQPRGRVTISVTFVREGATAFFADVPETYWAYDEIAWAYENGYVNGTSAATFAPGASISRQQVWMILARLSGADPANMAEARQWAIDNGISDGTTPGNAVTRQQLAALLYRFAQMNGQGFTGAWAFQLDYPDADQVSEYAYEAMCWMTMNGVIAGTSQGTLNPTGTATRAQFAVMLYRFWNQVG